MTKSEITQAIHEAVDAQLNEKLPGGMEAAIKLLQSVTHDDELARKFLILLYRDIADLSVIATVKTLSGLGLLNQEISE